MNCLPNIFPKEIKQIIIDYTNAINNKSYLVIRQNEFSIIIRWDPLLKEIVMYHICPPDNEDDIYMDKFTFTNIEPAVGHIMITIFYSDYLHDCPIYFKFSESWTDDCCFEPIEYKNSMDDERTLMDDERTLHYYNDNASLRRCIMDHLLVLSKMKRNDLEKRDKEFFKQYKQEKKRKI